MKGTHKQVMAKKQVVMDELKGKFDRASIIIFTDYRGIEAGLTVKAISDLRRRFREHNTEYKIAKNKLILRVLQESGIEGFEEYLKNPIAVVIGYDDPVSATKALVEFGKTTKTEAHPTGLPVIKAAFLEGKKLDEEETRNLAKLPTKPELLAKLLALINAPATRMMGALNGSSRNILSILTQWNKKREEGQ